MDALVLDTRLLMISRATAPSIARATKPLSTPLAMALAFGVEEPGNLEAVVEAVGDDVDGALPAPFENLLRARIGPGIWISIICISITIFRGF